MMCGTCPDFEFGLHLYQEAMSGGDGVGPEGALMHAYSLWLLGGGSPEGFEDLTEIDAMLMVVTRNAEIVRLRDGLLKGYAKLMGGFEDG